MKTTLLHSQNFVLEEHMLEHPTGVDETRPCEVLDLTTLIKRASLGEQVFGSNDGYSDDDYPDLHQMDDLDIHTMRMENLEQIEELKQQEHEFAKELAARKKADLAKKAADEKQASDKAQTKSVEARSKSPESD